MKRTRNVQNLSSSETLEFRMAADEIDAIDIEKVVNDSYSIECIPDGEYCFRRESPKISVAEIESNLLTSSCKSRWIVLETPSPQEDVVAAARFNLNHESKTCTVDICCAIGNYKSDDKDIKISRFRMLLKKIENIVYSHNLNTVVIEVSSWRHDIQEILMNVGYGDNGGHSYCEDQLHMLVKPSMILEFHKDLTGIANGFKPSCSSSVNSSIYTTDTTFTVEDDFMSSISSILDKIDNITNTTTNPELNLINANHNIDSMNFERSSNIDHNTQNNITSYGEEDSMEGLMAKLFSALHSENKLLEK